MQSLVALFLSRGVLGLLWILLFGLSDPLLKAVAASVAFAGGDATETAGDSGTVALVGFFRTFFTNFGREVSSTFLGGSVLLFSGRFAISSLKEDLRFLFLRSSPGAG